MARPPRELESREKTARSVYVPPSALPDPSPRPGWVHRWIAASVMGENDPSNVSKRFREGWEPVKAEDYPELAFAGDKNGNVEIGGLILCALPEETAQAREEYYAKMTRSQMESVDNNFMQQNDARMPLFKESKTSTTRGRGEFGSGSK